MCVCVLCLYHQILGESRPTFLVLFTFATRKITGYKSFNRTVLLVSILFIFFVLKKKKFNHLSERTVGKFGTHGSGRGQLEHPHYIAVSSTNRVIVSDSNNHRVQIFDVNGRVLKAFGSEGSDEGQFKFPRGVAVDDQGYIVVADSGNNRIQMFTPEGDFLASFGFWGSGDG